MMKNKYKHFLKLLSILLPLFGIFSISLVNASDNETILNCFGDEQTYICINQYDLETTFIGSSPENITISPEGGGGGVGFLVQDIKIFINDSIIFLKDKLIFESTLFGIISIPGGFLWPSFPRGGIVIIIIIFILVSILIYVIFQRKKKKEKENEKTQTKPTT